MAAYVNKPKKVDRSVPSSRDKENQKIYQSSRWKKLREAKRLNNPLCEKCILENKTTPTQHIHHIIPFSRALTATEEYILAYNPQNLMAVCSCCHDKLHKNYVEDITLRYNLLNR